MKGKATSFDIAYQAGVSQSTVSRALRDSPAVNQETKDRIFAIAKQLNYKVDKNASNLRKQRSGTLALLLFEDPTVDESQINPFFLSMLGSITRACTKRGHDLLISFQQLSNDWHADYEDSKKADGIILLGYGDYMDYEEKLHQLLAQQTHFVCWGAKVEGHPEFTIRSNNQQGGRLAGEHLWRLGRKNYAFIGNASEGSPEFSNVTKVIFRRSLSRASIRRRCRIMPRFRLNKLVSVPPWLCWPVVFSRMRFLRPVI